MTKSQLMKKLAERFPLLDPRDPKVAVNVLLDAIAQAIKEGKRIEIRGFGSFDLVYRRPRRGRNPQSGQAVLVPHKYRPRFKPGKELRERINKPAAGCAPCD